jgi:anthranilate/para-aminobenzoate synthase component I
MYPSFGQFSRWAGQYNVVPLWIEPELPAKSLTDWVHAYGASKTRFFFMHSAANGGLLTSSGRQSRYSYFALDTPRYSAEAHEGTLNIRYHGDTSPRGESLLVGNPFGRFAGWLSRFSPPRTEALPPFWGGAVGYFSYDSSAWLDPKMASALNGSRRPRPQSLASENFPPFELGIYDAVGIVDHARNRLWLVHSVFLPMGKSLSPLQLERVYRNAQDRLRRYAVDVQQAIHHPRPWGAFQAEDMRSNRSEAAYRLMVRRAKGFIAAGDIYQANLSQSFSATWSGDPWTLYRRLTQINPSPYAALWRSGTRWIVSSSPELLARLESDQVETRPIAGTYPRKADVLDPMAVSRALAKDTKEKAEHIMLVDLERNDLGRICRPGTVKVAEALTQELYSHVIHLVSDIRGTVLPGRSWLDVLRAVFPGGTITGCPKLSSMDVIHKLEPQRRGLYTGSMGWIGFSGDMTLNILIRSFFLDKGHLTFPVGAGIVADSDPAKEYQETLHKAAALLGALRRRESPLPRKPL